ncbi:MAG: ABC transporter ATP-binding protein [Lachnospiraceae bacterium]|jgi:multiple sugar transport system ATP-binding protein|nr:ABC transporter ATP-binding protein [Lachnospiraceae bacterium]
MSKLVLSHIDKYYGTNHVLKDLSLEIEDGDFMTLLGPSGCGKTTTLRVIAGLERPQNGNLTIDDNEIINCDDAYYAEPSKRNLNLVFQSYALWPHMTVFKNIAFGLKVKKMGTKEIEAAVMNSLRLMRIEEFKDRYPNELSGGQQQRVAIARAIASDPKLLLLDEPLSNLDAKLRIDMRSELKRLHKEMGTTIIYVTHDQVEALTMSTKIALFRDGRLVQVAKPIEFYMNPVDLKSADFIGNPRINFIDAVAELKEEGLKVSSELGTNVFPKDQLTDETLPTGEFKAVIGLRPEQIHVQKEPAPGLIPAKIYASQPAGSETLVTVSVGALNILAKEIGILDYVINEPVYLRINPNKLNVYNYESERLIKRVISKKLNDENDD